MIAGTSTSCAERRAARRLGGEPLEQAEVGEDLLLGVRPLHLDDDPLAAAEHRAMHLRDRPAASGSGSMLANTSSHGTRSSAP